MLNTSLHHLRFFASDDDDRQKFLSPGKLDAPNAACSHVFFLAIRTTISSLTPLLKCAVSYAGQRREINLSMVKSVATILLKSRLGLDSSARIENGCSVFASKTDIKKRS